MAALEKDETPRVSSSDALGPWAFAAILLVSALVFYTGAKRFLDPVGEKYIEVMSPGGADFTYPFNGARALLRGINPYVHTDPELVDPWQRDEPIDGVMFRQFYPPSHLLLYVPLAWATSGDIRAANRIWFHLTMLFLMGLSYVCWKLSRRAHGVPPSDRTAFAALLPFFLLALGANQGVSLGLERGQSDVFSALLCWGAVFLWLSGHRFWPMFLVTWATLLKGYAALLAAGLGVLTLFSGTGIVAAVAGTAVALLVNLGPVLRYLSIAAKATSFRANMFWPLWYNHSFKNLAYFLSPGFADAGRWLFALLAAAGTALAFVKLVRVVREGGAVPERTIWMALFSGSALATMLGASGLSCSYNLVLVLPAALVAAVAARPLATLVPAIREPILGAALLALAFFLFVFRVGPDLPVASLGLLGLPLFSGALAVSRTK